MSHKKTASQDSSPTVSLALVTALFLISLSVLVLQISYARIFSVFLGYHFVFIAVSTATLGIGLGAMLFHKLKTRIISKSPSFEVLGLLALGLSLSILASLVAVANISSTRIWFIYIVQIFPPFFLAGMFLALSYHQFTSQSNVLYFADLAGAAFGCLGVVLLLQYLGGINTVAVISLFPAVGGIILLRRRKRGHFLLSLVVLFGMILLVSLNLSYEFLMMNFSVAGEPHKTLLKIIKENRGD
ncbi:MAG: hypothetical protein JSW13_05325, partial [Candidatus Aerophobus sp.]